MNGLQHCLKRNLNYYRELKYGRVELCTFDWKIDLHGAWEYKAELLDFCNDMGVNRIFLRSDTYRCSYSEDTIYVNPPTTMNRIINAINTASHTGLWSNGISMGHRMLYETGSLTTEFIRCQKLELPVQQDENYRHLVANEILKSIVRKRYRFDTEAWHYARSIRHPNYIEDMFDNIVPGLNDQSCSNGFKEAMQRYR